MDMIVCFLGKLKLFPLFAIMASALIAGAGVGIVKADELQGIEISKRDCARIVAHKPMADVEYKPGVDASGDPVVPADLPGSAIIEAPNTIVIPITIDVADLFTLPAGVAGETEIGKIEYDIMSDKLEFNGQPLTDPQMAAISAACANLKK